MIYNNYFNIIILYYIINMAKLNIKEILRRLVKYLILVLCIGFIIKSVGKDKLNNNEIFVICVLSGLVYCIIDIICPSIKLILNDKK